MSKIKANRYENTATTDGGIDINTSGLVGIGTASPDYNLTIGDGSSYVIQNLKAASNEFCEVRFGDTASVAQGKITYDNGTDSLRFTANATERLRIDSAGKLLVGTSTSNGSAGSKLEVAKQTMTTSDMGLASFQLVSSSSRWPQVFIEKSRGSAVGDKNLVSNGDSLGELAFRGSDGTNYLTGASIIATVNGTTGTNDLPTDLRFSTTADGASSPTERMRITNGGVVAVNRTTALHGGVFVLDYTNGTSAGLAIKDTNTSGTGVVLHVVNGSGTIVGGISQNQSTTSFNTSSDYRLKKNVVDITDGIARVKQLQPRRFNFIANDTTTVDGFVAHEAQAVVPEAVTGEKDGDEMQGIDQSKLVPLLTAALQEAITKIETLEARVTTLEAG